MLTPFKERFGFNVWFTWVLLTLGIYALVWHYKVNSELREFGIRVDPVMSLLAITFGAILIVPPFVSVYNTGKRIAEAQRQTGTPETCSGGVGVLLMFAFYLTPWYYQAKLNQMAGDA